MLPKTAKYFILALYVFVQIILGIRALEEFKLIAFECINSQSEFHLFFHSTYIVRVNLSTIQRTCCSLIDNFIQSQKYSEIFTHHCYEKATHRDISILKFCWKCCWWTLNYKFFFSHITILWRSQTQRELKLWPVAI